MTFKKLAASALLPVLAVGCGEAIVAVDSTVERPYDGPMHVERDTRDRASVLERSGAAGLALECVGAPYAGGGGSYDDGLATVQSSRQEALVNFVEESWPGAVPTDGLVVERTEGHRTLLSLDVGQATKVAAVVRDDVRDWDDDVGWGVEAWATCDPAEFPAEVTDELGITVWQEPDGDRVPVTKITSRQGPEHCDWQDITFLDLGEGKDDPEFLRDVDGELAEYERTTYLADAALPDDAKDTGWVHEGHRLWLAADGRAAYLVSTADAEDVERWPATTERIYCA
ncbi:MAG: hypothetical protein ACRDOM_09485 [Nocardioides sp.]